MNPYAGDYCPPFAFSAFSYPLAQQLPLRVTCHSQTSSAGGQLDLPRSRSCRPECYRICPFSACLSPGSFVTTCSHVQEEQPAAHLFWSGPVSRFGPFSITRFIDSSHLLRMRNLPSLHAALRLAASHMFPSPEWASFEKYVVPGASDLTVTSRACPGRQLLVVQQVTVRALPHVTRQERALPPTTCRLTRGGRRHVSH